MSARTARRRLRSHDGCDQCRRRRKKCDEVRDACTTCTRLGLVCTWRDHKERSLVERPVIDMDTNLDQGTRNSGTTKSGSYPIEAQSTKSMVEQMLRITPDPMNYCTSSRDNVQHLALFDRLVCRKVMPMAVRFSLHIEQNENVVLSAARRFPPLRHAICAMTLLNGGLHQRPELIAGSFKHYHSAIEACIHFHGEVEDFEAQILLHFILLIFDISSATLRWPQERESWSIHMACLASLVYRGSSNSTSRLCAYLYWYTLFIDSQAGLLCSPGAGNFVQAYLDNGSRLPQWPIAPSTEQTFSSVSIQQQFLKAHRLSLMVFQFFAEQSRLSMQLQQIERDRSCVTDLYSRHSQTWTTACMELMGDQGEADLIEKGTPIVSSTFAFARYQFSVLSLLLVNKYPSKMASLIGAEQTALHRREILAYAEGSVLRGDRENHHLAPGIFVAVYASHDQEEQERGSHLLTLMENSGFAGAVRRTRLLLESTLMSARYEENEALATSKDCVTSIREQSTEMILLGM